MFALALRRRSARLLLACWVGVLAVAAAAPLLSARGTQLVCSAGGAVRLLVDQGDGHWSEAGAHQLDCALCLPGGTPPPLAVLAPAAAAAPSAETPRRPVAVPGVRPVAVPPPARGPPVRA